MITNPYLSKRLAYALLDRLGMKRNNIWADDLMQAAVIALWQTPPNDYGHAWVIARSAMIHEWRRLTPGSALPRRGRALPVTVDVEALEERRMVSDLDLGEIDLHYRDLSRGASQDTPEAVLRAKQAAAAVDQRRPGIVAAIALAPSGKHAAAQLGISESRITQWGHILADGLQAA